MDNSALIAEFISNVEELLEEYYAGLYNEHNVTREMFESSKDIARLREIISDLKGE